MVQDSNGLSPSRSSIQTSRLCSNRDENRPPVLQWNDNSPGKHGEDHHHLDVLGQSLVFCQRGKQRFQGRIKMKEEQAERIITEINGNFGAVSPSLKRKRPLKLHIPKSPRELKMISLKEKAIVDESNSLEGDHYGFYCKKGRKEVMEDTHNVTTNILGDDKQTKHKLYLVMDFINGGHLFFQLQRQGLFRKQKSLEIIYSSAILTVLENNCIML